MSTWRRLPVFLVVSVLGAAGCASGDETRAERPPAAAAVDEATTTTAASTTTTAPEPEPEDFAVGRLDLEVVDPSRPTAADPARNLPDEPDRTMAVMVLYPAEGEPVADGTPVTGAPAERRSFPLVVFSHGVTATGPTYLGRLQRWARAGYVVAAPTFPRSSGPGGQIGDYVNQPDDVHFVTDELVRLADSDDHPLHGAIDGERIALAGHSLGAITTVGAGLHECCALDRTDAVIEISGIELPFPGGTLDPDRDTPFLAIHGAADPVVPVSGSDNLFAQSPAPSYYLRYSSAGHSDLLAAEAGDLLDEVLFAFLDRYLKDDPAPLEAVDETVEASGLATFEERNT